MENFDKYYRSYKYMEKLLATDFTYNYLYQNLVDNDKGEDVLAGKINEKVIDMEWVMAIEDALPYIEKAIDEQRRFIKETNEVYRIDKAKIINKDSVKHLSQHTNYIAKVEGDKVTPNKVLTVEREESFEIYENRFLITLVRLALEFVSDKYSKMVNAPTDTFNKIVMKRDLPLNNQHVTFYVEYSNEIKDNKTDLLDVQDYEQLSDFDRVRRIREKLNSFLNTAMMKAIANCIPVRPPILHTNLMVKNPNYKAALDLYTYLTAYKKPGYEIIGKEFSGKMDPLVQKGVYIAMGFEHFMVSITTNSALKDMLEDKYQEENRKFEAEHNLPPEEQQRRELERIEQVRKEEMKLRLQEIREREKTIRLQKSEIAALKREIEKRDRTIETLKSTINALEEEVKTLQTDLSKVRAELIAAQNKIKELEAKIVELEAEIERLTAEVERLTAEVAHLQEVNAQLEAKIADLEKIIEEQKQRIAQLEDTVAQQKARIAQLEQTVADLEKAKAELEARVEALEAENAAQRETIKAHEATIAQQKDTIASLEKDIADAKAEIASLNDTIAQRDETITQQSGEIDRLNTNVSDLESDLDKERTNHKYDVEAEKKAHREHVDSLNKEHKDETARLEQAHKQELDNAEKSHEKAIARLKNEHSANLSKLEKKYKNEKDQIQKTADSRVKAAKKDADKKAQAHAKREIDKAQKEARKAAKKANDSAQRYKKEFKSEKGVEGLYKYDYTFGALGLQTLRTVDFVNSGLDIDPVLKEFASPDSICALYAVKDGKKITLYNGTGRKISCVKTYKGQDSFEVVKDEVSKLLDGADKKSAYITYKTVDKLFVNKFAEYLSGTVDFESVKVYHNKSQKPGKSTLGIYYCKG